MNKATTQRLRIGAHGRGPGLSTFLLHRTPPTLFTSTHATKRITACPTSSRELAKPRRQRPPQTRKANEIDHEINSGIGHRCTRGGSAGLGASLIHGGV